MRAVHLFTDTDMRQGHEGLFNVAKSNGVDINKLDPAECVMFFNRTKDKVKVFSVTGVVSYARFEAEATMLDLNVFSQSVGKDLKMDFSPRTLTKVLKALNVKLGKAAA